MTLLITSISHPKEITIKSRKQSRSLKRRRETRKKKIKLKLR